MKKILLLLAIVFNLQAQAQIASYQADIQPNMFFDAQKTKIPLTYFALPTASIKQQLLADNRSKFRLVIGDKIWELNLEPAHIAPRNAIFQVDGKAEKMSDFDPSFKGFTQEGKPFRLTIDENFIAGILPLGNENYYIEPNLEDRNSSQFCIYQAKDLVNQSLPCLMEETQDRIASFENTTFERNSLGCLETEIAIATDVKMYATYNNNSSLQNRVTAVMNLVEGYYSRGEFNSDIKMKIVSWFIAKTTDPWGTSALQTFASWATTDNTMGNYDLAQIWTGQQTLGGGVAGKAYLSAVCKSKTKYSIVVDSYDNFWESILVAHEFGHNFNMGHSSGIMTSSLNPSDEWSPSAISQINSFLPSLACLSKINNCNNSGGGGEIPTPNFSFFDANPADSTYCTNQNITFENQSSASATSFRWFFEGGTPNSSTSVSPKIVYKNAGTFKVTLYAKNAAGEKSIVKNIVIKAAVVPDFTYKIKGLGVTFTNISSDSAKWVWKFGDGQSSTLKNPTHTYSSNKNYSVILTSQNQCGTRSTSKVIPVFDNTPAAAFIYDIKQGCAPLSVKITNNSLNAQSYDWTFYGADNPSSVASNPVVNYSKSGIYDIRLIVRNAGLSDTMIVKNAIRVKEKPKVDFSIKVDNWGSAILENKTYFADSLRWDFDNNTIYTDTLPVHFYSKSGRYKISLLGKNQCGTATKLDSIDVLLFPKAKFQLDSVYTACDSVQFQPNNLSSEDAKEFIWNAPFAVISNKNDKAPNLTYYKSGTYEIKLFTKNAAGLDSFSQKIQVVVKESPISKFSDSVSQRKVWFNNQSQFGKQYSWDFGDGMKSIDENPIHEYAKDGNYQVVLTVINDCDTVNYSHKTTILTVPKANFEHQIKSDCQPAIVHFKETASDNALDFEWYFWGATPNKSIEKSPQVLYENAGQYDVALVVRNLAGKDSLFKAKYLTIRPKPKADFSELIDNNKVIFQNKSTFANAYLWDFGDTTSSTEENPVHNYAKSGTYEVKLKAENDCGKFVILKTINLEIVANQDALATDEINIYPNPFKDNFIVKNNTPQTIHFQCFDVNNRLLKQFSVEAATTQKIDCENWASGFYFLRCMNGKKVTFYKIIRQ